VVTFDNNVYISAQLIGPVSAMMSRTG